MIVTALRALGVGLLAATLGCAAVLSVWLLLAYEAVPGRVGGWLVVTSAMLPAVAVVAAVLRLGLGRPQRARLVGAVLVGVTVIAALGLGVVISRRAMPSTGRLEQEVTRIGLLGGSRLVSHDVAGTARCQPTCPIESVLTTPSGPSLEPWERHLRHLGYRPGAAVAQVFDRSGPRGAALGWYGLHSGFAATVVLVPRGRTVLDLLPSRSSGLVQLTVQAVRRDHDLGDPR